MRSRAVGAFIGLVGLSICLTAQTARAVPAEVVVKYAGKLVKLPGAPDHDAFQAMPMPHGQRLIFIVQNIGQPAGKPEIYSPDPKVHDIIQPLAAGDLIDIVYDTSSAKISGGMPISQATVYKTQEGEDNPNGFLFDETFPRKEGDKTFNVVSLTKYKQKALFIIPSHKDSGSDDMVPDEMLTGIAATLQKDQVVYAKVSGIGNGATIQLLAPWANRTTGKFKQFDADATNANGDTRPSVELTDATGKTIKAIIPGAMQGTKWAPNNALLQQVKRLKADADVEFITASSGDNNTWLIRIGEPKPERTASGRSAG